MQIPVLLGPGRGHRFDPSGVRGSVAAMIGQYEAHVARFLEEELRRSDSFVDVGAHTGYFTRLALRAMPVTGEITAFEPSPSPRARLTALSGPRVTVRAEAIADRDGTASFHADSGMTGRLTSEDGETPVRSIDSLVADGMVPPATLKIDVEGAELAVLSGARETLSAVRALAVECHSMPLLRDVLARVVDDFGWVCVTEGGDFLGPPTVLAKR